jgi:RHS repeat-associated protein
VDTLFYPWGQPVNSSVESLWAGFNDGNGWLLHEWQTDTRRYTPSAGRWFTPDPLGGDVTNPQSLNRYAYVLNNPMTLTDPTGLQNNPCANGPSSTCTPEQNAQSNVFGGGGGANPSGIDPSWELDGSPITSWEASGLLSSGAVCIGSCTSWVEGSNHNLYRVVQTAGTPEIYGPNGDQLFPDSGSMDELGFGNLETVYAQQISSQCGTVGGNLAAAFPLSGASVDCSHVKYVQGAHANFSVQCGNAGNCAGRWGGGLHVESELLGTGDTVYWGHNDTASYYIGQSFNWGTFSLWNLFVHATVDVAYGNTGTYMFPH